MDNPSQQRLNQLSGSESQQKQRFEFLLWL
jgi:hypothetical protein